MVWGLELERYCFAVGYKACDCFRCDYEGNVDGFDGVTIAEFDADMNIYEGCCKVKNYLSVLQ